MLVGAAAQQVSRPLELLEPAQVLGQAADGARVLLPAEDAVVSVEVGVSVEQSGALDLLPVLGAHLDAVDVRVAVVRLRRKLELGLQRG